MRRAAANSIFLDRGALVPNAADPNAAYISSKAAALA
jgi:hypothetical protein